MVNQQKGCKLGGDRSEKLNWKRVIEKLEDDLPFR